MKEVFEAILKDYESGQLATAIADDAIPARPPSTSP